MVDYYTQKKYNNQDKGIVVTICVQYHPLLRKAEFTKIIEKYHMALDQ